MRPGPGVATVHRLLDDAAYPDALVVRTSAFFGPWDEHNFATRTLRAMLAGVRVPAADDVVVSPTYVPDLVDACLDLLIDAASGIWHLSNHGAVTWAEFARRIAVRARLDPTLVIACPQNELALAARRPAYSALTSERGTLMPSLEHALDRFVLEVGASREVAASNQAATQLLEA